MEVLAKIGIKQIVTRWQLKANNIIEININGDF